MPPSAPRIRRWLVGLVTFAASAGAPSESRTQETIYDPENPAVSGDDDSTERESESSGGEVIVDPENPETPEEPEEREMSEETDDGGENGEEEDPSIGLPQTRYAAGYGTGLWIDTDWSEDEDVVEWQSTARLKLEQSLSSRWSAELSGEFHHWMAGEENPDETNLLVNARRPRAAAEARLGESYALYRSDRFAFRVGHLVTSWGRTDLIRPGDVINPVDATEFAGASNQLGRSLPRVAAELSYLRPRWSLTGVVAPFFKGNRVALFGRDTALLRGRNSAVGSEAVLVSRLSRLFDRSRYEELQPLFASPNVPDESPSNASLGLRWSGTRWNTDFGFGYFWGWDRTPSVEIDDDLRSLGRMVVDDGEVLRDLNVPDFVARNPEALDRLDSLSEKAAEGERLFSSEHERQHTVLFDFARYFGPVGVRADLALHPERTFVTRALETVRRPTAFAAAGLSYERIRDDRPLVLTLEGFWLEALDADASVTRWLVSEGERGTDAAPLLLFEGPYRGAAGALEWALPWADLEFRTGAVVEIDRGGVIVDSALSRRWASWMRTSLGVRLYEGPDPAEQLSLGGLYDPNDQIGATIEGAF